MKVLPIKYEECENWLLKIHYAKRIPCIEYSFGLYNNKSLVGVITYGSPPSPSLCVGICGDKYKNIVIELNRLVLKNNEKNLASFFISQSFKLLPKPLIIVSYADTSMNHNGYVYQATNFIYTGLSAKRNEWRIKNSNLHSKTISQLYTLNERKNNKDKFIHTERSQKHRYIYFLGSKVQKKQMLKALNYNIEPYPKNENKNYKIVNKPITQGILF